MLTSRRIVLGISGGIAAYKTAELTRSLVKKGASVKIVMTEHAQRFVAPLTFQTLSDNPVYADMFSPAPRNGIVHISLAAFAEILVVAPATANVIGKFSGGLADDLLSTLFLATTAPVLVCPAMNEKMYLHPAVQDNLTRLRQRGCRILAPGEGWLACGAEGQGRMAEPEEIAEEVETILSPQDMAGERVLVTAGPTQERFDPVRFISNCSSGKMGYALARAARRRGADVTLVSGPTALPFPRGVRVVAVSTAREMRDAVQAHFAEATIVVKAAAVADYRPETCAEEKIKKQDGALRISLVRNPDILAEIGRTKGRRVLVGFAMESKNLLENARQKLVDKNLDFIVANDVTEPGAGFQVDTNVVTILGRDGFLQELPLLDKTAVADRILDCARAQRQAGHANV